MYNKLTEHLKRPMLYERTTELFRNDEYIATQMLKAHLDPNTDAVSRQPDFIYRCAEFIASILPEGAKILDIGCGPGLYTKQFSKQGLQVTGLDFSENSINYAREHDPDSEYILQDYLSMDFDSVFDIVTLIYFDYGALIPNERQELLRCIYKALKPNGLLLFDVMIPQKGKDKYESTSWNVNLNGGFWSANPHVCLNADYYYGDVAKGSRTVVIEEKSVRCFNLWDCYFTRQSLLDETTPYGFTEYGFYNDVKGKPYTDDSQTLCVILKKGEQA